MEFTSEDLGGYCCGSSFIALENFRLNTDELTRYNDKVPQHALAISCPSAKNIFHSS